MNNQLRWYCIITGVNGSAVFVHVTKQLANPRVIQSDISLVYLEEGKVTSIAASTETLNEEIIISISAD